jgi:hypothetical protein
MAARRLPNRTGHETVAMQRMAVRAEEWWEYHPKQVVMTADGILGTVTAVSDGPIPGTEEYHVQLAGGLGGGSYTASQLSPAPATTAVLQTAAVDYPELAQVLVDKPDPALERRSAAGKPWEDDEDEGDDDSDDDKGDSDSKSDDDSDDEDSKDDKSDDGKKGNPFDRFSSLVLQAARDQDFRFQVTSAWRDVVAKAKRIRSEGGVRVTLATDGLVIAEVKGDHHVYESGLQRLPGRTAAQTWSCGCIWGAYHWGADDDFSRFAGRMCSHALALQYEAQARGMFGRDIETDDDKPSWVPRKVVVRYDIDDKRNDLARSSSLDIAPLRAVASAVVAAGGDVDEVLLALATIGVTASVNSPFGEPASGDAVMSPKMPGATSPHRLDENPASAGPLVGGDPAGWSHQLPGTLDDRLGSRAEAALFEPGGAEGTLNDTPQCALPATDGDSAQIPADDESLSPQMLGMRKRALKDFTPSERRALIDEGDDGTQARNLGDLQIQGTHYAALEEELAAEAAAHLFD